MNLILEVIGQNARSLGPAARKVFGPEGGRIGRSPDCDWVLANPYISRHHATIRWISGTFYIEPTGENGVAIGNPQAILPQLERRALKSGDRLFIDEYEIAVGLVAGTSESAPGAFPTAAGGSLIPGDEPFDQSPTRSSPALVPDPLQPSADELDPLKGLTGRFPAPNITSPRSPESHWNHTSGTMDHFAPPPVPPPAQTIPDDWDKTSFGRARPAASPAPPAASPPAQTIPDDWDKTSFNRKPPPAPAAPPPPQRAAPPAPPRPVWPIPPQSSTPQAIPPQTTPPAPPPQAAPPPPMGAQSAAAPAGTAIDLATLLRSAGVDPASLAPETAASLGYILRTVVQGVIDVLHARAEIKTQFRLPVTRVKQIENNPLKFSVNAEDALGSLLGRRNPAYMPPIEAFEDAFDDIRFHQLAMLAGMRAGFENVMSRFDPERLQEDFEKQIKRGGLLSIAGKSRYWDLYSEMFQQLAGDQDSAFRRLFGEEFATAYEKQLETLKRSRKKPRR